MDGGVQIPEVFVLQEVTGRVTQSAYSRSRKSEGIKPLHASTGWSDRRRACRVTRNRSALKGISNKVGPLVGASVSRVGNISRLP